jgi:cytochrome d ubiquinol oxidase subunit I
MEAHFPAAAPAGMYLFGWVDNRGQHVTGVQIPGMLSWLIRGDARAPIRGLNAFDPTDLPPVNATFQFYHGMVAIGLGLIVLNMIGLFAWWRGWLLESKWLLRLFVIAVLGPQVANQLGWFTAEVGRQPWIVYGMLRTSDGLSKVVTANQITASLVLFVIIYALLFAVFIYVLHQKIVHGPEEPAETPPTRRAIPQLTTPGQ